MFTDKVNITVRFSGEITDDETESYITGTIYDAEADPLNFTVSGEAMVLDTKSENWVMLSSFTGKKISKICDLDAALSEFLSEPRTLKQLKRWIASRIRRLPSADFCVTFSPR